MIAPYYSTLVGFDRRVVKMNVAHSTSSIPKSDREARCRENAPVSLLRRELLDDIVSAFNRLHAAPDGGDVRYEAEVAHDQSSDSTTWQWNARQDVIYSHIKSTMSDVLHIFHSGWHGIRAAAGSLPGTKLAITDAMLSIEQMRVLVEEIISSRPTRIVFHGVSDNTFLLVNILAARGLANILYLVFHGSPMMWHSDQERRFAYSAIELKKRGNIKSLQFMKADLEIQGVDLFSPLLFNMSPRVSAAGIELLPKPLTRVTAFLPGWRLVHKNIFVSALGAALSPKVEEIQVLASDLILPAPASEKIRRVTTRSRETTFALYASSAFSLNISIIDCHPMVNVESQAFGRPCLRGRLFLDALEDHEYVKNTTVENPSSTVEIRRVIDRLLSIDGREINEMTVDYQKLSDGVAIARYHEFLGI